ncbi:MAG: hypothetical protein K2M84_04625 [Anaeroplasmataceae bacterium]|nr:hypothetical protein [Anaeroplasmataceae bacterium]MDE7385025.1 hypothetical protein [Anaeroplasmataceae bacterium]
MLEFFEYDDSNGFASIYDSHITLNKTLLKYFKDAYRVRVAVDKENSTIHVYIVNKDYALSGELKESSLIPVSISKTYARICSRPLIEYLSNIFNFNIAKKEFKRFKACYDDVKQVIIIDMKGEVS